MILALDLATRTGWAAGAPRRPPAFGSFRLDADRDGARLMQMARRINELIVEHGVTSVVMEAPHVGRADPKVLLPLFGFRAAALMAAEGKRLPAPRLVAPATWRKTFIGQGRLPRQEAKAAVLERCRWLGLAPANDDEGDAIGLWSFAASCLDPQHTALTMRRGIFAPERSPDHDGTDHGALATEGRRAGGDAR